MKLNLGFGKMLRRSYSFQTMTLYEVRGSGDPHSPGKQRNIMRRWDLIRRSSAGPNKPTYQSKCGYSKSPGRFTLNGFTDI